ncbi:MAG: hypothetical protein JWQ09_3177 [Segetibacter sp.]|nr:hypothetical protein [Segetibacter sp.]
MKNISLKIGCDGGCIIISSTCVNGLFIYHLTSYEIFTSSNSNTITFIELDDAWSFLKKQYKKWYQLYLVQISTQMTEVVKKDYILENDKNEYTIESWMMQLTGRGIGF